MQREPQAAPFLRDMSTLRVRGQPLPSPARQRTQLLFTAVMAAGSSRREPRPQTTEALDTFLRVAFGKGFILILTALTSPHPRATSSCCQQQRNTNHVSMGQTPWPSPPSYRANSSPLAAIHTPDISKQSNDFLRQGWHLCHQTGLQPEDQHEQSLHTLAP